MARTKGRVIIAKIDSSGKKIKGSLATWIKNHPGEIYFDSSPEWEVWDYMIEKGIPHEYEKELTLFDGTTTTEFKNGKIVTVKQRPIKYTPDYYLPEYDTYIEVKGWADELFKMRWKLFKLAGHTGYLVYSLEDFIAVLKLLKKSTTQ
jgi:hypothetical protein